MDGRSVSRRAAEGMALTVLRYGFIVAVGLFLIALPASAAEGMAEDYRLLPVRAG